MYVSPEELVTAYIERLIRYPGALQVVDFADGRVRLVGLRAVKGGLLVGQPIRAIRQHIPKVDARVAAIYRGGHSIVPEGDTVIEHNDEVFFIAGTDDIRTVMAEMRKTEDTVKRVVIAGGGNIGLRLALKLEEDNHQVKLIERSTARARRISEQLRSTIVLNGDAADEELLVEENIDSADVFCCAHEFRGSQHPLGAAREAPRRAPGHGADHAAGVRGAHADRPDRRGHLAADGHDRLAARLRAPRRRRAGALAARRRGGGDGDRRARQSRRQGGRPHGRGHPAAGGRADHHDRAWRRA